jgi:hypothetical protein
MNSFQRQSLFCNTNFSSSLWKKDSTIVLTYNSTISDGFFSDPGLTINSYQTLVFTNGKSTIGSWTVGAGTGTTAILANGTTPYYSGTLPTGITNQYFISTNGTSTSGNVQTLTQTLSLTTPGTYYVNFYIVPGTIIDPNHTLSVYIGGVNVIKNYSPVANGMVANGTPVAITLPFVVPPTENSLPLVLGFVFYCPNSNSSYLGVTGITQFSQSVPSTFGYSVVDPSAMSLYLPFNTDLLDHTIGTNVGIVTYNGTGTGLVTPTTAPVLSGSGCLALNSTDQNYFTISKSVTLPSWSSTCGFTFSGWFYGLGTTQNYNATIFTVRSSTSSFTLTYYAQQPFLIFTANPWGVVCSLSNYYLFNNSWNHFAVTIGGGTSAGNMIYQFYLNGTPITSTTGIWPANIYNTIHIGYDTGNDASFGYFNGYIDEIRIYTRCLTLQEINALSCFVTATPSYTYVDPTSMIMYYPMDSGTMNIMYGNTNSFVVSNGLFTIPSQSGVSANNPSIPSWKFITNNGAYYTLHGIGSNGYSYGLPSGSGTSTQYTRLTTTGIGSSIQMYQTMILLVSSPSNTTNYMLSFTAFPLDGVYSTGQSLSVSIGNMILLNQTRFVSSTNTVPYTYFCIPFTTTLGKNMKLNFTTYSTVSGTSSIGITDISLVINPTVGSGYNAIDTSAQTMYYHADTGGTTTLANFATGTSMMDATITSSSMITKNTIGGVGVAQIGANCLSFTAQNTQLATLGSLTVSSIGSKPGLSFSGWFYPINTQTTNSTLFSFKNTTGGSISCFYNGDNNWLDFSANPGNEYIAWSYRIIPNTWNFFCYVIQYVSGSVANHTYYWNDVSMATITGAWVNTGSIYNTNYLGYSSGLGYYNGYMEDFRVYNRALSIQDVFSLWNYGYQTMGSIASTQYANLIDSSAIQLYYPFDQGTGVTTYLPFFNTQPSYGTIGFGTITLQYGPATNYYYVTITRNKLGIPGIPVVQSIGATSFVDISLTGITADSSYTYTITPTSISGNNGNSYTTSIISPTSDISISNIPSTLSKTGITLNFWSFSPSYVSFYDVSISRIGGGVITGVVGTVTSNASPTTIYSYNDSSADISANTTYQYLLSSHNAINVGGGTVITPWLSPYAVATFVSYTDITKTSLTVNFGTVTSFYDVSISRISNIGGGASDTSDAYVSLNVGQTSYTDTMVTANLLYKYAILPYNAIGISGDITVTSTYTSPTSDVSFYSVVSSTSTDTIGINFGSVSQSYVSYYDVSISRINGGVVTGVIGLVASNTSPTTTYSYTDTNTDIYANTTYQYLLTSHNAINESGGTVITPLLSPYPVVNFSSYTNVSKNGVTVNFGTVISCYNVSICRITNTVGYDVYGSYITLSAGQINYSDQGFFSAVSNYKYAIIPYNAVNNSGDVVFTPYVSPISDVSYSTFLSTPNTLTIYFMSASNVYLSYASITVSRVSGGVVTGILGNVVSTEAHTVQYLNIIDNAGVVMYYPFEFPSTFYLDTSTDISANTTYQYLLSSKNAVSSEGGTVLTPLLSPSPVATFISYTDITKTSLTVNFGTATSFYDVSISRISNVGGGASDIYYTYDSLNVGQTSYTDTMVTANLLYKYAILPYNAIGISGEITITPTYTSPTSDVSFYSMVSNTSTNTISMNFGSASQSYVSFNNVSISRISGGVVSGYMTNQTANTTPTSIYTYTDTNTDISANKVYVYQLTSYNALNINGDTAVTQIWSPYPVVTFTSYTNMNTANITVNFGTVTSFYNVNIARITNTGGSDVYGSYHILLSGQSTYVDTGDLFAIYTYRYGLSPVNAINNVGDLVITPYTSPTSDISFSIIENGSYNNIATNSISVFWSNASQSYYSFYDVSISRIHINTGFVAPYVMILYTNNLGYTPYDYSYVDTGVLPNTLYQYQIVSYNAMNVSGGTVTTPITCTLPYLNTVDITFDISANIQLTTSADSSYNYVNIYRNNNVLYYSNQYSTTRTMIDNSNIVVNLPYNYTITPYNFLHVTGTSYNQTYQLVPIINGFFNTPTLTSGTNTLNPSFVPSTTYGWTISGSNNYYVANGIGSGLYTGILPSTCTQYFISVGGSGKQTLSQSFPVPTAGNYYITFFVFAGSSIDNGHTLSVSIGSINFIYNYSLGSVPNTKPIPITFLYTAMSGSLYLPIVFTFTSSNTNLSYYGITGIQCFGQNTPSLAYTMIDPLSMSHYYSFVTDVSNYATGTTAIADTVAIGTTRVTSLDSTIPLLNNQPALSMTPTSYITSSTTTSVPTWSSTAGFSLSGWFYGAGTQATDASLVTLSLGSSSIWLTYKTTNILTFAGTNVPSLTSKVMYPNTWNHLAISISGGTVSSANASYSLYINGFAVSNSTGIWPDVGAYTVRIGNNAGGGGFNGYMNELRIYQRAITPIELQMLWNMGMSSSAYTIIDPIAMVMYYPINMGGVY